MSAFLYVTSYEGTIPASARVLAENSQFSHSENHKEPDKPHEKAKP